MFFLNIKYAGQLQFVCLLHRNNHTHHLSQLIQTCALVHMTWRKPQLVQYHRRNALVPSHKMYRYFVSGVSESFCIVCADNKGPLINKSSRETLRAAQICLEACNFLMATIVFNRWCWRYFDAINVISLSLDGAVVYDLLQCTISSYFIWKYVVEMYKYKSK
jgi:hypothetical protein